jgi:ABC-type thiamine transport system substrate-binding protein
MKMSTIIPCNIPVARAAGTVNVYSYRQPALIDPLLAAFTQKTGIEVKTIFAENGLVERLVQEARNSPADVLLSADVGRLVEAAARGAAQPVDSAVILDKIPGNLRDPANLWFGLSGDVAAPILLSAVLTVIVVLSVVLLRLLQTVWKIETFSAVVKSI